jgi:3-methyladenine DNA glycosylase AlkD
MADPERAQNTQRFFKHPVSAYGVETPALRRIVRDWLLTLKHSWDLNRAVALCDLLIKEKQVESKGIGILILAGFKQQFSPELLATVKKWLESHCDNWATVDTLAPSILSPIIGEYPNLIPRIISWKNSPVLWVRRAAVVTFVPHARKGKYLNFSYTLAESLFSDQEDLMHKALGWLLREAGRTNQKRLKQFLLLHGPEIPRTTVRYAIEKFPEDERKRLLEETR